MSCDKQGDVGGVLHQVGVAKAAYARQYDAKNLVTNQVCVASIWHLLAKDLYEN